MWEGAREQVGGQGLVRRWFVGVCWLCFVWVVAALSVVLIAVMLCV